MSIVSVNMPLSLHHQRRIVCVLLLFLASPISTRNPQISDLKSKISGVEELLEEFRKQLQQEQTFTREGGLLDVCLSDFNAVSDHIIRSKDSIEKGATFLASPSRVYSWKDCVHACCADAHCTVAVVRENIKSSDGSLSCYLFNCTYRNKNVCTFSMEQGFTSYSKNHNTTGYWSSSSDSGDNTKLDTTVGRSKDTPLSDDPQIQDVDEPPRSDAGQDVVIQLPTDWALLDGSYSLDDHEITRYEWALLKGEPSVNMKVTHPGLLKVSGLQEGTYTFQMTVTDTAGQKSSDNVTITVLAPKRQAEVCTGRCTRYQFMCDDGCCIDITYACDGKQQCPDRSDEAFCQNLDGGRKSVTHAFDAPGQHRPVARPVDGEERSVVLGGGRKTVEDAPLYPDQPVRSKVNPPAVGQSQSEKAGRVSQGPVEPCSLPPDAGPCQGVLPRWYYDPVAGECKHFIYGGCSGNRNSFMEEADCVKECLHKPAESPRTSVSASKPESDAPISKAYPAFGGHPVPESGAILPLALGLIITALLLLMVACRMRLMHRKLKKTRPLTTDESDYLINGMYL